MALRIGRKTADQRTLSVLACASRGGFVPEWRGLTVGDGTRPYRRVGCTRYRIDAPEIARAMTSRWISEVPSKIV